MHIKKNSFNLLNKVLTLYSQSPRVAILLSGKGSNADIVLANAKRYPNLNFICICTDQKNSNAESLSKKYHLEYFCLEANVNTAEKREIYFKELALYLNKMQIDTLIYAGFMKISPAFFVHQFPGINVHPADLTILNEFGAPKYVGMHAIKDALHDGQTYLASTAHIVDAAVDCGSPIMVSKHLALEGQNKHDIANLHEQLKISCEHLLYPRVLELMSKGMISAEETPLRWTQLPTLMQINNGSFFSAKLLDIKDILSPVNLAYLAQDYASEVGFDFANIEEVMLKVQEEFNELNEAFANREQNAHHFIEEIGDCFFSLINLCRFIDLHPKAVIKRNVIKYLKRCDYVESAMKNENRNWSELTTAEMINLWKKAKQNECK